MTSPDEVKMRHLRRRVRSLERRWKAREIDLIDYIRERTWCQDKITEIKKDGLGFKIYKFNSWKLKQER